MRVVDLTGQADRAVEAFGSMGFTVTGVSASAHVTYAHLEAGGRIGRHDAPVDQLLVVLDGRCTVSGFDEAVREIGPGQAALWSAGEAHETVALTPSTLLIVESPNLTSSLR